MRHEVKTMRPIVIMLRRKVKTMRLNVKMMRRNVKTFRLNVKTMRLDVKTMRHRNTSNMTVFEAFSKRYILTDYIFIIKKNMSNVSCECTILAIYEVNVNVEN